MCGGSRFKMTLSHIPTPIEPLPPTLSERFNALPLEIREIGCGMELMTRIQQLKMEKARLSMRYRQSFKEIDDHIENCEKALVELGYQHAP